MSDSIYAGENVIQFPVRRAVKRDARRQTQYDALIDQLQAAHSREKVWLPEVRPPAASRHAFPGVRASACEFNNEPWRRLPCRQGKQATP
jgi:hypothetical protein